MNDATTDALQQMAQRVAEQLVAKALTGMVTAPVTITLHPQPARRLLEPSASPSSSSPATGRRGRKPGRKPAKSKRWTPAQRAKFVASMAARRQQKASPAAAAPAKRKPGRPRKLAEPARCSRCDHTAEEHDAQTGKCLSMRCVCAGFWK